MIKHFLNKLFLVKEIRSKEGELHFLRYRLLETPWFRIYIHKICVSDYDAHLHTHPWNFLSFILKGGYLQETTAHPKENYRTETHRYEQFDSVEMTRYQGHRITLTKNPTWTLCFAYGSYGPWGYLTDQGFIGHKLYRIMKNEGRLPE